MELEYLGLVQNFNMFNPDIDVKRIDKQVKIEVEERCYRVDFLIPVWYKNRDEGKLFVIECDGHEFHQKTKEQVERDNQRTRALQRAGYIVMRFSGSEIYKSPVKCAEEVVKQIIQQWR